jgi:glyoxylase-like metal-dependent hydrolase (beta-lactamase superfamily II)
MLLGDFELLRLTDGRFRLDGGAMFGIVPRALWERTNPPDERNRILLSLGVLLIRTGKKNILIDTGIGQKQDTKAQDLYGIQHRPSLEESLGRIELKPADVDIVMNTHLHFDHAGGNTTRRANGTVAPAFPRARYFIQKGEWEAAHSLNERTQKSYVAEDFEPLEEAGCPSLIDGDQEIVPGVRVIKTPGHTEHHESVMIESCGEKACFLGDLIPTSSHLPLPYIMGYDILPLITLETKRRLLEKAFEEQWLLIFQHDPRIGMGRLRCVNGKLSLDPVEESL